MKRVQQPVREIDLSRQTSTEGLDVIESNPTVELPITPPLDLFAGLPTPSEAPYTEPAEDPTGAKGIWTAIEHL